MAPWETAIDEEDAEHAGSRGKVALEELEALWGDREGRGAEGGEGCDFGVDDGVRVRGFGSWPKEVDIDYDNFIV